MVCNPAGFSGFLQYVAGFWYASWKTPRGTGEEEEFTLHEPPSSYCSANQLCAAAHQWAEDKPNQVLLRKLTVEKFTLAITHG